MVELCSSFKIRILVLLTIFCHCPLIVDSQDYICPELSEIPPPCQCQLFQQPNWGLPMLICNGPSVTQETIDNLIAIYRSTNHVPSNDPSFMYTFEISDTSLTSLDLSDLGYWQIEYFRLLRNPLLDKVKGINDRKILSSELAVQLASLDNEGTSNLLKLFHMITLKKLELNQLKIVQPSSPNDQLIDDLNSFTKLEWLSLAENNIEVVGDSEFKTLTRLRQLSLKNNKLKSLNENSFLFDEWHSKVKDEPLDLILSNNELTDQSIHLNFGLKTNRPLLLNLDSNNLGTLSKERFNPVFFANESNHFTFDENPFICDLKMMWIQESKDGLKGRVENVWCAGTGTDIFDTDLDPTTTTTSTTTTSTSTDSTTQSEQDTTTTEKSAAASHFENFYVIFLNHCILSLIILFKYLL